MAHRFLRSVGSYLHGVLLGLDQFANTLIPGAFADETLSSRMGRRIKRFKRSKNRALESEAICVVLDAIDPDHCENAIEETPDGEPAARHLGRTIRELPRPACQSCARSFLEHPIPGHEYEPMGKPLSAESAERLRVEARAPVEQE